MDSLAGVASVTAGGTVSIVKVLGALFPALPAASDCVACTVYVPSVRALEGATDQLPLVAVPVRVSTGGAETLDPAYTLIVTLGESPGTVPAVPEKLGLLLFVVLPLVGWLTVMIGAVVSTVNVLGVLLPRFPAASLCCAWAV